MSSGGRGGSRGGGRGRGRGDNFSPRGRSESSGQFRGRGGSGYRGGSPSDGGSSYRGRGDSRDSSRGGSSRGGWRGNLEIRGPPAEGSVAPGIYGENPPQPDRTITTSEDNLVKLTRDQTIDGFPGRRSYGTEGTPVILRTNYFTMTVPVGTDPKEELKAKPLHRYIVTVVGTELSKKKRRRLLAMIAKKPMFQGKTWATDYSNIIATTERLDLGPSGEVQSNELIPPEEDNVPPAQQGPPSQSVIAAQNRNRVTVKIKYEDTLSLQETLEYLKRKRLGAEYQARVDVIQLLNIIMCKPPQGSRTVVNVGQNKFYPFGDNPLVEAADLGSGLQALRGYFLSVRPAIDRLLVNINVTSGAFYQPLPVEDLLKVADLHRSDRREQAEAFLHFLNVKVEYKKKSDSAPSMTKIKSIRGFARPMPNAQPPVQVVRFGDAHQTTFSYTATPGGQARNTTVFNYFRDVRGIALRSPNLPVLNVGTLQSPVYVPMELCTVLPGQPYRRFLSGDQTTRMIGFASRRPNQNAMSIAGTPNQLGHGVRLFQLADQGQADPQQASVIPFGFRVSTQMLTVPGRVLKSPNIQYDINSREVIPASGSWDFRRQKFARGSTIEKMQILVINHRGQRGNALPGQSHDHEEMFSTFKEILKASGVTVTSYADDRFITLDDIEDLRNRTRNDGTIHQELQSAANKGVKMVLVILPSAQKWLYSRIKTNGDIKLGIHTVDVVGTKALRARNPGSFWANVALKINIKAGGTSHRVVRGALTAPLDKNTMLVGIDVTHPSPGSKEGAPSIACVVASTNEDLMQFPGSIRTQTGREEMVAALEAMFRERLRLWEKKNGGRLPTKILIYRDGVSETQYELVLQHELPPIKEAFKNVYGDEKNWPKLTIVIVGKRHHTRFYPTTSNSSVTDTKHWNPIAGTVVDRGIAGRNLAEFWLQAHQGLQGTARPAHYVVIKDEIKFEANDLQRITHNMCYLYNRATKAVSICPPAYYADLLCTRGRFYLHETMAENNVTGATFNPLRAELTDHVHDNLKESTWYI